MEAGSQPFVTNRRDVAHESFDDEVIVIHFPTGKYFRLDAAGRVAWSAVNGGATAEEVAAALCAAFDVEQTEARVAAETFLSSLAEQGLVVRDGVPRAAAAPNGAAPLAPRAPFRAPRIEAFDDLQDLFLVDPIHDVDEAGWPHAKP